MRDGLELAAAGGAGDPRALAGMWSGEPFAFDGSHYQVREPAFPPRPVQALRIPIWIGGSSRLGPVGRAARRDGMLPVPITAADGHERHLTPNEVRDLRARIAAVAKAGATWWMEWIPAGDERVMREAIGRGPLRSAAASG